MPQIKLDYDSITIGPNKITKFDPPKIKNRPQHKESRNLVIFKSFIPKLNDNQLDKFTKAVTKDNSSYMLPCTLKHMIKGVDEFTLKIAQQLPVATSVVKNAIKNIQNRGIKDKEAIIKELPDELYSIELSNYINTPSNKIPRKYKIDY